MKDKKFIFVNNEWWKVFNIEDFRKPSSDAGIGETVFYSKLKRHSSLCVNKEGRCNQWIKSGSDFTVISKEWPNWTPVKSN